MANESGKKFLASVSSIRHDLPFSPVLLEKLFNQTGESSMASLEQVGETISQDQGLTTKVLALANSAFYGLQAQVSSVSRAIAVLGLREVRNIVLALGVKHMAGNCELPSGFDIAEYWKHQITVALMARNLASISNGVDRDDLFTAGLLHDLGKLIVAMHCPDDWSAIHALEKSEGITCREAEERYWGLDHGVVGALVMRSWNLPVGLSEPVNWHHCPDISPDHRKEATLLCLADYLAQRAYGPESPMWDGWQPLARELVVDELEIVAMADDTVNSESISRFVNHLL